MLLRDYELSGWVHLSQSILHAFSSSLNTLDFLWGIHTGAMAGVKYPRSDIQGINALVLVW